MNSSRRQKINEELVWHLLQNYGDDYNNQELLELLSMSEGKFYEVKKSAQKRFNQED